MQTIRSRILPVNILLLVIGLSDLVTTLVWLHTGQCIEFNPIMAAILKAGVPAFAAVKLSTLLAYVGMMEWYRRHRSAAFAALVGRVTVLAYCGIYVFSFCLVNRSLLPV